MVKTKRLVIDATKSLGSSLHKRLEEYEFKKLPEIVEEKGVDFIKLKEVLVEKGIIASKEEIE